MQNPGNDTQLLQIEFISLVKRVSEMIPEIVVANYTTAPLLNPKPTNIVDENVDLKIDKTYNTNFKAVHGIRELVQNLYDGAKSSALELKCVDVVIEVCELKESEEKVYRFMGKFKSIEKPPILLAAIYICKSIQFEKRFTLHLFNFGVALTSNMIIVMGRTSKDKLDDHILHDGTTIEGQVGKFGDGALCGIIALLRAKCSVDYFTNSQQWTFSFVVDSSDKSKELLNVKQKVCLEREIAVNTNIILDNVQMKDIDISRYLFLYRASFPVGSGWRFQLKGATNLLQGIEIFVPDPNDTCLLFNRSLMLTAENNFPFISIF